MSEEEGKALSTSEFWDARYKSAKDNGQPTHEWFRTFNSLQPFFSNYLYESYPAKNNPRILHLGCGDSTVPQDLAIQKGYTNQLCVDFSKVVVDLMSSRTTDLVEKKAVEWICADVRDMKPVVPSSSIDVAFDKGTMDAMIFGSPWSPPEDVQKNTSAYIAEVFRVLKNDGVFLYVTYRQPHFVKPLLNRNDQWNLVCDTISEGGGSFDYYCFTLRKKP